MLNRRCFITAGTASIYASHHTTFGKAALAQTITKPAHLIIGFPPGGAPDVLARLLAEHMKGYAPSVIIENLSARCSSWSPSGRASQRTCRR